MSVGIRLLGVLKKYPLALACLCIVLVCGLILFLRSSTLPELSVQESELSARIRVLEQNVRNATGLEAQQEELAEAVEQMQTRLFRREERAVNINFFYEMERRFNVRVSEIRQLPDGYAFYERGGVHELKLNSSIVFTINLQGSLSNILSFVHQIHQNEPFMRVTDLQLSLGGQRGGVGQLESRLRVVVMAQKD